MFPGERQNYRLGRRVARIFAISRVQTIPPPRDATTRGVSEISRNTKSVVRNRFSGEIQFIVKYQLSRDADRRVFYGKLFITIKSAAQIKSTQNGMAGDYYRAVWG